MKIKRELKLLDFSPIPANDDEYFRYYKSTLLFRYIVTDDQSSKRIFIPFIYVTTWSGGTERVPEIYEVWRSLMARLKRSPIALADDNARIISSLEETVEIPRRVSSKSAVETTRLGPVHAEVRNDCWFRRRDSISRARGNEFPFLSLSRKSKEKKPFILEFSCSRLLRGADGRSRQILSKLIRAGRKSVRGRVYVRLRVIRFKRVMAKFYVRKKVDFTWFLLSFNLETHSVPQQLS